MVSPDLQQHLQNLLQNSSVWPLLSHAGSICVLQALQTTMYICVWSRQKQQMRRNTDLLASTAACIVETIRRPLLRC